MAGYERIRAIQDFDSARSRAFRRALRAILTGRPPRLHSIEPMLKAAGLEGSAYGGIHEIPVDRIIGSAASDAKTQDFDPGFLPINRRMRERWTRIYQAMVEGDELPPIDVYQVDGRYYVIDGHHRVSVARNLGRPMINARVINVRTRAPLDPTVDAAALLRAAEYAAFLETTQLHRTRPNARLEVSRLGRYDEILKHILGHAYFMGLERGRAVPLKEAAASWYDNVYRPIEDAIREHKVLDRLPGWTEADAYVEIARRWLELSEGGAPAGPHSAVHDLLAEHSRSWWRRRSRIKLDAPPPRPTA
ncbi:MAG TPA: ParB N-terminal domain-containing protein [Candidatus Dormibacteraeota bacterium]|nr:ParB N-terminal domain-containing protein [Candidatus Dormibacteraeota bacterium]